MCVFCVWLGGRIGGVLGVWVGVGVVCLVFGFAFDGLSASDVTCCEA